MHRSRVNSDAGSILIHVAVGLFALTAMTTFVFDWGVMWVARRQAQNAADAGALSGAVAMAFDICDPDDDCLKARQSAIAVAQANYIWGEAPVAGPFTDDPANTVNAYLTKCPDTDTCIRVDVYRDAAHNNPLPMFFGQLVGLTQQDVRATAMARTDPTDWVEHLRPWAVPDQWIENFGPGEFQSVDGSGNPLPNPDEYRVPTDDGATGYNLADDAGRCLTFDPSDLDNTIAPGNYFKIALGDAGDPFYLENIANGSSEPVQIGSLVALEMGGGAGPSAQAIVDLIARDPAAHWVGAGADGHVEGSAFATSPRIVPIAVFDPVQFEQAKLNGEFEVVIVNILGFFLEHADPDAAITGCLMTIPGTKYGAGVPNVNPASAFLKVPLLIR